ncbi:YfhE family protein [Peribacillus sp. SCS-26]
MQKKPQDSKQNHGLTGTQEVHYSKEFKLADKARRNSIQQSKK